MSLRIGITMRVTKSNNYYELRDSISQDWISYFNNFFPETKWILIPNSEENILRYIELWKINAFIFSGGEDFGLTKSRDITENVILKYALKKNLPILGICRGLQLIIKCFGGTIIKGNDKFIKRHLSTRHKIIYQNSNREINSYHSFRIDKSNFPNNLKIIATDSVDKSIEAVQGKNILGLMWHPERERDINWEKKLILNHFNI